jgi:hypothetical protein
LNLLSWWRSLGSVRNAGLALYKRGMTQANQHHDVSAMASYTEVIELLDVPPDVRAMALYNRALLHVNNKNFAKAQDDLNVILALPQSLPQIKLAARQKLERMKLRQQNGPA